MRRVAETSIAAANGAFRYRRPLYRRSDLSGGVHPGRGALVADHHRRHSGLATPASTASIDDLLIDASIVSIDGAGGILGQAGPDLLRPSRSRLPAHGEMEFDSADVASMFANGTWTNVILHEIGHILGIGTLWSTARSEERRGRLHRRPRPCRIPHAERQSVGSLGSGRARWRQRHRRRALGRGDLQRRADDRLRRIGRRRDADQPDDDRLAAGHRLHGQLCGRRCLHAARRPAERRHHRRRRQQHSDRHRRRRHDLRPGRQRHAQRRRRQRHARRRDRQRFDRRRDRRRHRGFLRQSGQLRAGRISASASRSRARTATTRWSGSSTCALPTARSIVNDGSTLFDTLFYDRTNLDVFHAGVDARAHYNRAAGAKAATRTVFFSSILVSGAQPGRARGGVNPLTHYQQTGWREGRDPGTEFRHQALSDEQSGRRGGRRRSARALPAVRQGGRASGLPGDRLDRRGLRRRVLSAATIPTWRRPASTRCSISMPFGWREGRNPNALFDTAGYLSHYTDVRGGRHQSVAALRAVRLARRARSFGGLRYAELPRGLSGHRGRARRIRSIITSTAASTKAARPSPTASGTDATACETRRFRDRARQHGGGIVRARREDGFRDGFDWSNHEARWTRRSGKPSRSPR